MSELDLDQKNNLMSFSVAKDFSISCNLSESDSNTCRLFSDILKFIRQNFASKISNKTQSSKPFVSGEKRPHHYSPMYLAYHKDRDLCLRTAAIYRYGSLGRESEYNMTRSQFGTILKIARKKWGATDEEIKSCYYDQQTDASDSLQDQTEKTSVESPKSDDNFNSDFDDDSDDLSDGEVTNVRS